MSYAPFVPLRVFSAYTMLEGTVEPKKIPVQAKKLGFPAVGMVDRNGLYGVMAFQDACKSEGIQPIIGTMLAVARPDATQGIGQDAPIDWLALYAQNDEGYQNLCALVSRAHLDRPLHLQAHVPFEFLDGRTDGLMALTAGGEGAMARLAAEGQADKAAVYLTRLQSLFPGRLYMELSRRANAIEDAAEDALVELAYAENIPLVATNPVHYAEPSFHPAHDIALCIANGEYVESQERVRSSPHDWMKTDRGMRELFADMPEAIANTLVVAQRCAVWAPKRDPILPSLAGDLEGEAAQLRADAAAGLERRLEGKSLTDEQRAVYNDRLKFECDIIVGMGFPGYFLIVADFIKWAKDNDIPVGPGRGSGAGSLVAWALTITDLDPLELGLLFERFLNPERVSMPDFDIDFCETRRGEVIRYVQEKYGRDHVAQIITFGKLKARAVLRDTGRVLQMPYGQIDRLCKMVPNNPADPCDLAKAIKIPEIKAEIEGEAATRRLFELAGQLEGLPRHSSTHAAGVVIGDRPLAQLVPLYCDPRSDMPVTQFDMKYVETAGLVKFDFLGLKTLSVLQKAVQLLKRRDIEVDLAKLPVDDVGTYELLKRGDTVGVFQLESEGMRRTLSAVKPTNFGDIIALVSLYRPGPMDNIPLFGRRKNGEEAIEYPHPLLEGILRETYGIFVYQEQVMQAGQILAGYSLGDADLLRRAMGKKIKSEMDAQRERFVSGCAEHSQIEADKANELFDAIAKFAEYGFNKSHAAAYALLAYHTAWLKAHYPHEFLAASMCFDMHQTDKLSIFMDDMKRLGIAYLPPCVNHSEAEYHVEQRGDGTLVVRYALAGLKNVGEKAMEQLVAERQENGPFASLEDFSARVDPTLINRRSLENLAAAGAFDALEQNRAQVSEGAEVILATAVAARDERVSGQGGLFGDDAGNGAAMRLPDVKSWSPSERMAREKECFGFYFANHPASEYRTLAMAQGAKSHADIMTSGHIPQGQRKNAVMAALVENVRWRDGRRARYIMAEFSDETGQFTASCFDETACAKLAELASASACALLQVELDMREGDDAPRITVRSAEPLAEMKVISRLRISAYIAHEDALLALASRLEKMHGGHSELIVKVLTPDGSSVHIRIGNQFDFNIESADALQGIHGLEILDVSPLRISGLGENKGRRAKGHLRLVH